MRKNIIVIIISRVFTPSLTRRARIGSTRAKSTRVRPVTTPLPHREGQGGGSTRGGSTWGRSVRSGSILLLILLLASCSTTSNLPDGEILYTGIKSINIHDKKNTYAESFALTEVEGALAYAPNGSFMGSSSLRTPFPIGLWIHNAFINQNNNAFEKWLLKSFGTEPVTIASVLPETRVKIATNTLQNYGYFSGRVTYDLVNQKNPKKQKIKYDVYLNEPSMFDSIQYHFEGIQDSILQANFSKRYLHEGDQFSVPNLQAEQTRISNDFRNNGFYYYRPDYIRFFADSMQVPLRVKTLVIPDADINPRANRQWYIGNIHTYIQKNRNIASRRRRNTTSSNDSITSDSLRQQRTQSRSSRTIIQYDDSIVLPGLKYAYQGKKTPIKPRVLFKNYMFNRKELYSQQKIDQTLTNLANTQAFQQMSINFTPRDTTSTCDTIDVQMVAMLDQPYDLNFEFGFTQKSNSQVGPKAKATLTKRNAFGHGERLSIGLLGSYEWQTRNRMKIDNKYPDSWEAGLDASITYPWLVLPKLGQRYFKYPASTTFSIKIDNLKRAGYYRLVSSEIGATYNFQTSKYITHQFSPLMLTYNHLINATDKFFDIAFGKQALFESISDRLIPAMLYTFKYDNNTNTHLRNTTRFTFTIKESANLINGILALCGKDWNEKDKGFLDTPYSQFTKFQMELANCFRLTDKSMIATRLLMGVLFNYGNSVFVPYSELFYSGGPNSIRAFGVRTIGPGSYDSREFSDYTYYLDRTGNFKLEANVEYRFNIVSNLNGALFVDAGNVWLTKDTDYHPGGLLSDSGFLNSIALGTGFGFRYDMEYLVLRLDFGIGIHSPYSTKKSYYNIEKFRDGIGIHFAVGYPF